MAEEDIIRNMEYIAIDKLSPGTALEIGKGLRSTIKTLTQFPYRHELDEDEKLASIGVRKLYFKNYKIFYKIDEGNLKVYILGVLHMLVDSKALLIQRL